MKKFTIRNNHIIIEPDTDSEVDVTELRDECSYCQKHCKQENVGFCDQFKAQNEYEEV